MFPSATFRSLPKALDWETVTVDRGSAFECCVAGSVVIVESHFDRGGTRVCAAWASGDKIGCVLCGARWPRRTVGYLPTLTKLGERRVVLMSETVIQRVKDYQMGTPLRFVRAKRGNKPLSVSTISPYDMGESFVKKVKEMLPLDINAYLLHLWQMPLLTEFFGFTHYQSVKPIDPIDKQLVAPAA